MNVNHSKMVELENELVRLLKNKFGELLVLNNNFEERVPGILNIQIKGINNMVLLKKISPYIAASTGSACGVSKPSRVLKSLGMSDIQINQSLRLSLSHYFELNDLKVLVNL